MVAQQQSIEQDPQVVVAEMTASLETFARHGEWERVEEITAKLRTAVMQVPEHERRDTLLTVRREIERVQMLASDARGAITEKLSAIRRGKDATAAYGSATGTEKALTDGRQAVSE